MAVTISGRPTTASFKVKVKTADGSTRVRTVIPANIQLKEGVFNAGELQNGSQTFLSRYAATTTDTLTGEYTLTLNYDGTVTAADGSPIDWAAIAGTNNWDMADQKLVYNFADADNGKTIRLTQNANPAVQLGTNGQLTPEQKDHYVTFGNNLAGMIEGAYDLINGEAIGSSVLPYNND